MTVLAHNYRFFPLVAELRERIRAGELGRIHLARGHFLQDRALRTDVADWRIDALRGGASRAIADVGSHWLDLAEVLTGRLVASVVAQVATIHPIRAGQEVRTEDQAALLLRFAGGLPGSLVVSQVAAGRTNEMEISLDGDRGSATWRQHVPDELWLAGADGSVQIVGRDGLRSAAARELATAAGGRNESRRNLVRLAYQVIRGSHASDPDGRLPTFADGAHQLSITAAALESARTGLWVDVDEPS